MEFLIILTGVFILGYYFGSRSISPSSSQPGTSFSTTTARPIQPKKNESEQGDMDSLSEEQEKVYQQIESTNEHLFITGKAGTGKSYLLKYLKTHSSKKLVVVAPTGVAAINIGGQTIHSLFKFPPKFIDPDSIFVRPKTAELLSHVDMVVIDEVSMVRADIMDGIDISLRQAKRTTTPFGGVQIVMFGDPYQLPPVVDDKELQKYFFDNHGGYYFFNAHVWNNTSFEMWELETVYRQKDSALIDALNAVRNGVVSEDVLNKFNARVEGVEPQNGTLILATTNNKVASINESKLSSLSEPKFTYDASIAGQLREKEFPADEHLHLKKGAQVMMLKNDREKRWVNGTLAVIDKLSHTQIWVKIDDISYNVMLETWKKIQYTYNRTSQKIEEEVVSSFTQYPVRLAWAVTIHKAQGQTHDSIAVDLGSGAFAHGQTYVALSRCRTLEGVTLTRPIELSDVIVDPIIVEFMTRQRRNI